MRFMRRRDWWAGALEEPAVLSALVALVALVFVLLRLDLVAHGDVTRFVDVGSAFAHRSKLPRGVAIVPGSGYDGQFYYRLGLDPANLHRSAYGITLDNAYRLQRITYSALAWLFAGGQVRIVPYSLVVVNIVALGALAWLGAVLARDCGRRAAWGLLIAGYFGFLFSLGRDLTEICEACFVVAGLLFLRRRRPVLAGVALAGAVLSRETALVVVAGVALVSAVELVRRRRGPGWADAAWILPGGAYLGWLAVGWAVSGSIPLRSDSQNNLTFPFVSIAEAVGHYVRLLPSGHSVVWLVELSVLATVAVLAGITRRRSRATAAEKAGWALSLLVLLFLTKTLWYSHADFRGFEDAYVLSTVVLLDSDRKLRVVAVLVAVIWSVTFIHRVLYF